MGNKPPILTYKQSPEEVATEVVRNYCGWHIGPPVRETLTLDGTGTRRVPLPSNRIITVHSVTVNGEKVQGYKFSSNGWVQLNELAPDDPRAITVDMTHGHDSLAVVAKIISALAGRISMSPAGNITSQRAGTQYVGYGTRGGETTGVTLLQQEKEELAPYHLGWTP